MRNRRGGRYSAGVGKLWGTPTVNPPESQGIDDYSGFKVPHAQLKKDWQGLFTTSPDVRNPQDYLRGIKDDMTLPNPRPEAPNQYVAFNIIWQDGSTMLTSQTGQAILTQGVDPESTL